MVVGAEVGVVVPAGGVLVVLGAEVLVVAARVVVVVLAVVLVVGAGIEVVVVDSVEVVGAPVPAHPTIKTTQTTDTPADLALIVADSTAKSQSWRRVSFSLPTTNQMASTGSSPRL